MVSVSFCARLRVGRSPPLPPWAAAVLPAPALADLAAASVAAAPPLFARLAAAARFAPEAARLLADGLDRPAADFPAERLAPARDFAGASRFA